MPESSLKTLQKSKFVSDFTVGMEVAEIFLLSQASQQNAKNGPYWRLEFRDRTGSIGAKIWSPQSQNYPNLEAGLFVRVEGRTTSYRDQLEITPENLYVLDAKEANSLDLIDFMVASAFHPESMLQELQDLCKKNMPHKPWQKFITLLLKDEELVQALRLAPAAKGMHHAYAGGLLEHTLSVCKLCMHIADNYPHLDRQVLLAGAVCHDLGKIWELSGGLLIDYTTEGRLIGHISLAMERLLPYFKKSGLEPELVEHLKHLILSHHGTLEFGSPKLPSTAEAFVLHYADNIDAKLQQVATALDGLSAESTGWSAYAPSLERFLYKALPTPTPYLPSLESVSSRKPAKGDDAPEPLPLIQQCSLLSKA